MASVVAWHPVNKKWYARPSTVAATTTVVFVGPANIPNPPTFTAADLRIYSGQPAPTSPSRTPAAGYGGY
ncbi:MAG: hypothetical protein JWM93_2482 [Frankiales bacterium]|nr:hypothetical protein [Frankiales bacterium]